MRREGLKSNDTVVIRLTIAIIAVILADERYIITVSFSFSKLCSYTAKYQRLWETKNASNENINPSDNWKS